MPVLPVAFGRALSTASPTDSRVLEARQLAGNALHTLTHTLGGLFRRTAASIPATASTIAPSSAPTSTLQPRQQAGYILVIATQYAGINSGPSPGAVVGIVLGSILGFLLIMWLLWIATNGPLGGGLLVSNAYVEEDISVVGSRRTRNTRRSRAAPAQSEMSARSPVRPPRAERVIRTERIVRDVSRPPRERSRSRVRETIIVEERPSSIRRVPNDDIVEVIEEHSDLSIPPARGKSRRGSYRSVQRDFYD